MGEWLLRHTWSWVLLQLPPLFFVLFPWRRGGAVVANAMEKTGSLWLPELLERGAEPGLLGHTGLKCLFCIQAMAGGTWAGLDQPFRWLKHEYRSPQKY